MHALFFQSGTDVEAFAKGKEEIYTQPFILALGEDKELEFFIIVDQTSIPGGRDVVEAVDRLFKVHYVFNVQYAKPVSTFFNFFDGLVYQTVNLKNVRPTVREIYSQIMKASEDMIHVDKNEV